MRTRCERRRTQRGGWVVTSEQMRDRLLGQSRRRRELLVRVLRALERNDLDLEQRAKLAEAIREEVDE